jgi:hypothetical protein
MKKASYQFAVIAMLFVLFLITSCKKEEQVVTPPAPGNEFLTTIKIRFQNAANSNDTLWAVWRDLSNGVDPPDTSKAVISIRKNSRYTASVHLYDETKSPADDITAEVRERANYHLYFFFVTGAASENITITATDRDTNSPQLPLGLENEFVTTGVVCSGRLEGVLKHQPNGKDGTFAPGSTDSDVFFTLNIIN